MRSFPLALLLALTTLPAQAQQGAARPKSDVAPATEAQLRQFVANFEAGLTKGCLQNPPGSVSDPASYCRCYARTLVSQYQPRELALINQYATGGSQNVTIIALMASPFARACMAGTKPAANSTPSPGR